MFKNDYKANSLFDWSLVLCNWFALWTVWCLWHPWLGGLKAYLSWDQSILPCGCGSPSLQSLYTSRRQNDSRLFHWPPPCRLRTTNCISSLPYHFTQLYSRTPQLTQHWNSQISQSFREITLKYGWTLLISSMYLITCIFLTDLMC